ncbi:metallophosphoesterase [Mucilaginibacter daejeonensis]|uniref:metallophosphoesterase n=1 Tax=Mucilaginibacter daejeonensis TaxID=398049 RepID=UPI001D176289|nr:metallophosphoesterase [Mucilaginibacter daejeonensis]UEG52032.1 metallophosphoesterase [Mucilaginibacter daejeonensis]
MRHGIVGLAIVLVVVSLLLDLYVQQGIRTLLSSASKGTRKVVITVYWAIQVLIVILMTVGMMRSSKPPGMTPFNQWVLSIFITLLVSKVFFVLVLFPADIYRLVVGLVNAIGKKPGTGSYVPARRRFVGEAAVLAASVPFTSFMYAMFKGKYDYKVHRQTFYFDDLPAAFDGFTITQLSDIHSGSFDNVDAIQRGIDLANAQRSDLFVFTGDLVNNVASEIEPYIDRFKQLKAPYGQFSILGNHDYGDYIRWPGGEQQKAANLKKLKQHHAELDYRLLLDEHVTLEKNGQKIILAGVQNWGRDFIQIGDLDKALDGVAKDDFTILLSHDPTHWEEKVRYHDKLVHLTLSGHTHGAQFGVETAKFRWSPVKNRYLDWAGPMEENRRNLYVNRGFGFLAFSGRLGIWPEITVIELRKRIA